MLFNRLIQLTENQLNFLLKNNSGEQLDLPCSPDLLTKTWIVSDKRNGNHVIAQLKYYDNVVAEYHLILGQYNEFIDEFFITR